MLSCDGRVVKTALPVSGARRLSAVRTDPARHLWRRRPLSPAENSILSKLGYIRVLFRQERYPLFPLLPSLFLFSRILVSLPERNRRARTRSTCTHECRQFPPRSRMMCEYTHVVFLNYSVPGPPQIDERYKWKSFIPCRPEK